MLALALELRCWVNANPASEWTVEHSGPHSPDGGEDVVLAAAKRVSDGPLHLVVENSIPIGKGLGSSAAAATAGAVAAWRAGGTEPADHEIFDLVSGIEAHPDNAAAAVYGGLVLCASDGVHRLPLHPRFAVLVAVPADTLSTQKARGALDETLDRATVVRSLARTSALVAGLVLGDGALLASAAGRRTPRGSPLHFASRLGRDDGGGPGGGGHACRLVGFRTVGYRFGRSESQT